jgi:hypothetical protein
MKTINEKKTSAIPTNRSMLSKIDDEYGYTNSGSLSDRRRLKIFKRLSHSGFNKEVENSDSNFSSFGRKICK